MSTFKGTIHKNDLEGGFWQLVADNGQTYQLKTNDKALQVEGLSVVIQGKVDNATMGIGMAGAYLAVDSWQEA